jgi:hypothetical protein
VNVDTMRSPSSLTRRGSSAVLPSDPGASLGDNKTRAFSAVPEPTRKSGGKMMRQVLYPKKELLFTLSLSLSLWSPTVIPICVSSGNCFVA